MQIRIYFRALWGSLPLSVVKLAEIFRGSLPKILGCRKLYLNFAISRFLSQIGPNSRTSRKDIDIVSRKSGLKK